MVVLKSVFLIVCKNIKNKKSQSILICITMMICAVIFATSLGMIKTIKDSIWKIYKETNASHDLIIFNGAKHKEDEIESWWRNQKEVENIQLFKTYLNNSKIKTKNDNKSLIVQLVELPYTEPKVDKLIIVKGEKKITPKHNEIWIPTNCARENNIHIGDNLEVLVGSKKFNMTVGAVVVDPEFSVPLISPSRIWLAPGELSNMIPKGESYSFTLGVRYNEPSNEPIVWRSFKDNLGVPFTGTKINISVFTSIYEFQYELIDKVLIIFSIIITILVLFITAFTIKNSILSDYKCIGVLKAIGFSSKNIITIYVSQVFSMALISIPMGIFISYFIIKEMIKSVTFSLGINHIKQSLIYPFISTFLILTIFILVVAYISSSGAENINPAQAIKDGVPIEKINRKSIPSFMSLKKFPLNIALAVKEILNNKKKSVFLLFNGIITVFVFVFSINLYNSLLNFNSNRASWGDSNSQISIERFKIGTEELSDSQLKDILKTKSEIKDVIPLGMYANTFLGDEEKKDLDVFYAYTFDGDMDSIGIKNIIGRNPKEENEISMAVNSSKVCNKKVGDYISICINGQKCSFLITGIYQSISNSGHGYRIQSSVIKRLDTDFIEKYYEINLKPNESIEKFVGDLNYSLKDKIGIAENNSCGYGVQPYVKATNLMIGLLVIVSIVLIFLNIFNGTLISIYENKKKIGVYKAIGISAKSIRVSIVCKNTLTIIVSFFIGIPLGLNISPKILDLLLSKSGIVEFPFIIWKTGTFSIIPICFIILFLATWIPSAKVTKINIRNLIQ